MSSKTNNGHTLRLVALAAVSGALILSGCSSPEAKVDGFQKRGVSLLQKGDVVKARLEFQNALQINPNAVPALMGMVEIAERNREWPRAFGLLSKVVELDPKNVPARIKLGKLLLASGQLDKALSMSEAAFAQQPESADVLAFRAAVFLKMQDPGTAVELANRALQRDPHQNDALVVLASERLQAGDSNAAVAFLDKGLAADERNLSLQLIKVQALERLGQNDKVEQVLRRMVALWPENNSYRYTLANFYVAHGQADKAEAEQRAILAANPKSAEAKREFVRFMRSVRGLDATGRELEHMIAQAPDDHDLKLALAEIRVQQKQDQAAEALWRDVIAQAKDAPAGIRARGDLAGYLISRNQKAAAKPLVDEMLAKDARNEQGLLLRAGMEADEGRLDDAVGDLRTILRDTPDSPRTNLMLARVHDLQGLSDLAVTHYARAAQAGHDAPQYAMPYAEYLMKIGRTNQVPPVLKDILHVAPNFLPAQRLLAQAYLRLGDLASAQAVADTVARTEKGAVTADQIRGAVQSARHEYDNSIASFKRAYDAAPSEVQPMVALVRSYVAAGKTREALAFMQSVLSSSPRNVPAHLLQGQLLAQTGDYKAAKQAYESAIAIDPNQVIAYQGLAALEMAGKNPEGAMAAIERGLKAAPKDFGLRLTRASLAEAAGKTADAIAMYEALLAESPNASVVANNLASLLADSTDPKDQQRAYQLAQRFRSSPIPQFRDTLGWAAYRVGKPQEASDLLKSAAKDEPELAVIRYHQGMNQLALKDTQGAKKSLAKAVELSKTSPFAQADDARRALAGL